MKTEKVRLSQVKVNQDNPRSITERKLNLLVERLLVFPKMISIRPVVVDDKMVVLGGNMRVHALEQIAKMSYTQIAEIIGRTKNYQRLTQPEKEQLLESWKKWLEKPTVEIVKASELSEAEKKEFIIADNASFGEWDYDKLANEWEAEDLNSWGVDVWQPEPLIRSGQGGGGSKDLEQAEGEEKNYVPKTGEVDTNDFPDNVKIQLEFTIEEYAFVNSKLLEIDENKEDAILKLLGYGQQ